MKKIMKIAKDIFFVILAIILIYAMIGNISGSSEKIYNIVKFRNYVVLTGSMEPTISPGDYITVKKVNPKELKAGDIITFHMGKEVVTHKIVKKNGEEIVTQGDANNVSDEPINEEDVIGKYMFKIPKIGYFMGYISTLSGMILLFGLVAVLIFWDISNPNRKNKKKTIDNKEYEEFLQYKKDKAGDK